MKPFLILLAVFLISVFVIKLIYGNFDYSFSGRIALAAMLIFTAIGHFIYTKGMSMMLPDFVPHRIAIVYLSGLLEVFAAIGIFIPSMRSVVGLLLITFFVLILPANIYASWKSLDYQTGNLTGKGLSYLWFRIPFQIFLILWTYFFVVKSGENIF